MPALSPKPFPVILILLALLLPATTPLFASDLTRAIAAGDSAATARLLASGNAAVLAAQPDENGDTPLHLAVRYGRARAFNDLLRLNAPVNAADALGRTPLFLASARNDTAMARILLTRGAKPVAADGAGMTALHYAASSGAVDAAKLLIRWESSLNAPDHLGRSPLHVAVESGSVDIARVLLSAGAAPNYLTKAGLAPLHIAVIKGDKPLFDLLLANYAKLADRTGTGLPSRDMEEATALHLAVLFEQVEMVEPLLDAGLDSRLVNARGRTPVMLAIEQGTDRMLTTLLVAGASLETEKGRETPVSLALEARDPHLLGRLLDHGPVVNQPLPSGQTPLLFAVERNYPEMVALLLERGADTHGATDHKSPLRVALEDGSIEVARLLLDAGADPDEVSGGHTPLYVAVDKGSLPGVRVLLEYDADVNLVLPEWRYTPLTMAIDDGNLPLLRLLVAEGADVGRGQPPGQSPLGRAIRAGFPVLREVLRAEGVDLAVTGTFGGGALRAFPGAGLFGGRLFVDDVARRGILHYAVLESDDPRVIEALVEAASQVDPDAGRDLLNSQDAAGQTPLHLAARLNKPILVQSLLDLGADPSIVDVEGLTALDVARGEARQVVELSSHAFDVAR